MSKIAIISDVHANIDALNLVLENIEKNNINQIICLGDLVTKYFYPEQVVDAIKKNCSIVIKGNCDEWVSNDERYKYARSKLGLNRIDYLSNLPFTSSIEVNNIKMNLYHSSPNSIDKIFNPLFSGNKYTDYKDKIITDYKKMFQDSKVSIVGHTHQSYIGLEKNNRLKIIKDNLLFNNNDRVIINAGSAGEHSHMILNNNIPQTIVDPYLTYVLLDIIKDRIHVEIKKVEYKKLLKKIYLNMIKMQLEGSAPLSPNDTKKLEKSLKLM